MLIVESQSEQEWRRWVSRLSLVSSLLLSLLALSLVDYFHLSLNSHGIAE